MVSTKPSLGNDSSRSVDRSDEGYSRETIELKKEVEIITLASTSEDRETRRSSRSNSSKISDNTVPSTSHHALAKAETQAVSCRPISNTPPWKDKENFFSDLFFACLYNDIPTYKFTQPEFHHIFAKHLNITIPSMTEMCSHFLEKAFDTKLKKIRKILKNQQLYIVLRVDPNSNYGYLLSLIIGVLDGNPNDSYLLKVSILKDYNVTLINQVIIKTLQSLWDGFLQFENLRLLVTDNSSMMVEIGKILKTLFTDLKHVTCIIQIINNLCLFFRKSHPLAEKFVETVSTIMSIEPRIGEAFKLKFGIDLPFERGNLLTGADWLKVIFYYFDGARSLMELCELYADTPHAKFVESFVEIIENKQLQEELIDLSGYRCLVEACEKFKLGRLPLKEQQAILENIGHRPKRSKLIAMLSMALDKNPDFKKLCPPRNQDQLGPKFESPGEVFSFAPLATIEADKVVKIFRGLVDLYSASDISANHLEMLTFVVYNKNA